ncbi:hypothetical protein M1M96_01280 [Peptococcaceae bacterium]|nr:hypothetical protein [Peptococcaceae bacterium]
MKYKVNLLPLELQPKKINVKLFAAVFILTSFFVLAVVSIGVHTWKIYQENIKLQEKIPRLQQEYEMERQVASQVERLITEREEWEAQIQNFNHLINIRRTWSGLLREIHNCIPVPKDLWFELVEIKYEGLSNAIYVDSLSINEHFEEENEDFESSSGEKVVDETAGVAEDAVEEVSEQLIDNMELDENVDGNLNDEGNLIDNDEKNKITIKAKSMSVESIGKFVYKLNQIKGGIGLSNIKLVEIKRVEEVPDVYEFTILIEIKRGELLYYDEMLTEEVPSVCEFPISTDLKHKDIPRYLK